MRQSRALAVGALTLAIGLGGSTTASTAAGGEPPASRTPPVVRGTAQEGGVLSGEPGRWRKAIDFSYQWRSCLPDGTACTDVPLATDSIYAVRGSDVGRTLRVFVTAVNKNGAGTAMSAPSASVRPAAGDVPHNTSRPTISGSAKPGQALTAAPGSWTAPSQPSFSYRWRICDRVGGHCRYTAVTTPTYRLAAADIAHTVRVLVTASGAVGSSSALSDPSAAVVTSVVRPAVSTPPTILGEPRRGQRLRAGRGSWTNSPTGFAYSWLRCDENGDGCDAVDGAQATTYLLTGADVGHAIRLTVAARNAAGSTTAASAPTAAVQQAVAPAPRAVSSPRITGTLRQGETLDGDRGSWANSPTHYDYAWLRCDQNGNGCHGIERADARRYALGGADVGATLRFSVTAQNAGGRTTSVSVATAVVAPAPKPVRAPGVVSPPTISGTAQEGQMLSGNRGSWSNEPTDYDYQWLRCSAKADDCDGIDGARGTSYAVSAADVDRTIRFKVEAKNAAGSHRERSAATARVRSIARPANVAPPRVTGAQQQGQRLTAVAGGWTHQPSDFDYAWLRCDRTGGTCSAISGADGSTYMLTSADVGNTLRLRITAKNSEGAATETSVPTSLILPAPSTPSRGAGCPAEGNPDRVTSLAPPARLIVDTLTSQPQVVSRQTQVLVVRIHVTSTCGGPVQGALVYATATPYNQFAIPPEQATDAGGWATLVFQRLRGFPVTRHQQLIAMFVRARKPGDSILGGISTRRLVSVRVNLR